MPSSLPPSFEFDVCEPDSGELEWLAFCYIEGELEESDRLGFEERLAEDQQAREAVAWAVELASSLEAAQSLSNRVAQRSTPVRERMWASIAICASLLAVLLSFIYLQNDRPSVPTAQGNRPFLNDSGGLEIAQRWTSEDLPVIWADVQGAFPVDQSDLWQPETTAAMGVGATGSEGGSSLDPEEDALDDQDDDPSRSSSPLGAFVETEETHLVTPAWMLAALTGETDGSAVGSGSDEVVEEKP